MSSAMDDEQPDVPEVTRSEERLSTSLRPVQIGRAILRRTVVVEERTITVQVRREEAHLEVVPFDAPVPIEAQDGAAHLALPEFVLHQEEIQIVRRVVPIERVKVRIDAVTEQQRITADLRHEEIAFDDGTAPPSPPDTDPGAR